MLRLGEKDSIEVLGPNVFFKREHELMLASDSKGIVLPSERKKRSVAEIAAK